ncbi:hypothetical protein CCR85_05110 [Rhodothalassium salexigens]|nr:hypothetical protein [Rhodothalassium salexigens]
MRGLNQRLCRRGLWGTSALGLVGVLSVAAPAQEEGAPASDQEGILSVEEIVVTGSRIRRAGFDTSQPAVQIDADFIDERGFANVATALNQIPAFGLPGNADTGGQSSQSVGQNFVNAFGLGSQRTLTLINGRRTVGQNTPTTIGAGAAPGLQVDLNIIPTALIDRVETVFVGGSPIYGADAVAATVNVILKDDFEGVNLDAQYGVSDDGDNEQWRVRGIWGGNFADGRGNAVVTAEYATQVGLDGTQRQRALDGFGFCENPADTGPNDGVPDEVFCRDQSNVWQVPNGGTPLPTSPGFAADQGPFQPPAPSTVINDENGNPLTFGPSGQLITFEQARLGDIDTIFFSRNADCGNNELVTCLPETNTLVSPLDRWVVTGNAHFEITDGVRAFVETLASRSESIDTQNQPPWSTLFFAPGAQGALRISVDNPFLSARARETILADPDIPEDAEAFFLSRSNIDIVAGSPNRRRQQVFRIVSGLEGDFTVFERDFNWDAYHTYGVTDSTSSQTTINGERYALALDAVRDPNTGDIVCRVNTLDDLNLPGDGSLGQPNVPTDIEECLPFNPFGINQNDQDVLNYLLQDQVQFSEITQQVAGANISGELFDLPAGAVSLALGFVHREEGGSFNVGQGTNIGIDPNQPVQNVGGSFNSDEFYGEVLIPVIANGTAFGADLPLIDFVEVNSAARLVDNNLAGSDTTWTAGGRMGLDLPWLGKGITLRGNYTRSIRSPSIPELFLPRSETFTFADDPCDPRFTDAGPNPATRRANCTQAFQQFLATANNPAVTDLDNFVAIITNASQPATTGGNVDLRNEIADSWTLGLVFSPERLPGLSLTVDWTKITLNDAIVQLSATQLLNACFDSPDFPTVDECGRFQRDPESFQVENPELGFANAAQRRYDGLIAELRYQFDLADVPGLASVPGNLALFSNFFYTDDHEQEVSGGDTDVFTGQQGFERLRMQLNLRYTWDRFSFLWQVRHTNGGVFDAQAAPEARNITEFPAFRQYNTTFRYQLTDNLSARLVVDNVLDKVDSPLLSASIGGNDNLFNDIVGRQFTFGLQANF